MPLNVCTASREACAPVRGLARGRGGALAGAPAQKRGCGIILSSAMQNASNKHANATPRAPGPFSVLEAHPPASLVATGVC